VVPKKVPKQARRELSKLREWAQNVLKTSRNILPKCQSLRSYVKQACCNGLARPSGCSKKVHARPSQLQGYPVVGAVHLGRAECCQLSHMSALDVYSERGQMGQEWRQVRGGCSQEGVLLRRADTLRCRDWSVVPSEVLCLAN
jgi:hypothetical protein